jgi:hypothetical protein
MLSWENIDFDWLGGNFALNYKTPEFSTSGSPKAGTAAEQASTVAQRASPAAERVDQPSGEHAYHYVVYLHTMLS